MVKGTATARRSQLLSTYGVGGLFPSENNSYLILGINHWAEDQLIEISEPRLARTLGVSALYAPPAGTYSSVPVVRFPDMQVCPACHRLGRLPDFNAKWNDPTCNLCKDKAELTPSRLIMACENGHLDDFPYYRWIHNEAFPADPDQHKMNLESQGRTSSLADILITCTCGARDSLAEAFDPGRLQSVFCTGKRPWLGPDYRQKNCDKAFRTVQRGASNVWFPSVASTISIPPYSELIASVVAKRRDLFSRPEILASASAWILEEETKKNNGKFTVEELLYEIKRQFHENDEVDINEDELRRQEYLALVEGRADGPDREFVAERRSTPTELRGFIGDLRKVTRLREVRALYGFTRLSAPSEDNADTQPIPLCPDDEPTTWLPAIETLGEGVFFSLDRQKLDDWSKSSFVQGRKRILDRNSREAAAQRGKSVAVDVDIVKMAVHTLAHVLIDQLSLDAGYPASAIRERLYVSDSMAGVLLYTATSDSAGSLGGIAAQAEPERFASAFTEGLDRLSWCSADPVCIESTGSGSDARSLAACHSCTLLPETSCELFNSQLDRALLYGTPAEPGVGFFSALLESAPL